MHTPMAQAVHRPRAHCAQRRVVARPRLCHSAHQCRIVAKPSCVIGVSQRTLAVSQAVSRTHAAVSSPPPVEIQKLYHDPNPTARTTHHVASTPCRIVSRVAALYSSPAAPYCDTNGRPQPRYKFCITTHPWPSHARARAAHLGAQAGRVMGPCRRASWPCRGPLLHAPAPCVTMQSIVS